MQIQDSRVSRQINFTSTNASLECIKPSWRRYEILLRIIGSHERLLHISALTRFQINGHVTLWTISGLCVCLITQTKRRNIYKTIRADSDWWKLNIILISLPRRTFCYLQVERVLTLSTNRGDDIVLINIWSIESSEVLRSPGVIFLRRLTSTDKLVNWSRKKFS